MDSASKGQRTWFLGMDFKQVGTLVVIVTCMITPLSVIYHNSRYFFSSEGFADGGDLYSHFTEANFIKETIQKGGTNFWFSHSALGYPMFTAYQPLPEFFIALCMLFFERIMSPMLVFRLIFVTILAFIPVAIYKSAQIFGLKLSEQIILCLLSFAIQSWRKFGLEIPAFVDYGLMTQAFGMLILFPAVSILYRWIMSNNCRREDLTLPSLVLSLSFLTNFFFGMLICILTGTMLIVHIATSTDNDTQHILKKIQNVLMMLATSVLLISWWVLACYAGYNYIGGLPWRGESEDGYKLLSIAESFTEGEMFDSHRSFPWFTILVLLGITISCLNTMPKVFHNSECTYDERIRSFWLLLSTIISFFLFLGRNTFSFFYDLIPLHTELETVKYLSALHFCGLLYASHALSKILQKLSEYLKSLIPLPDHSVEDRKSSKTSDLLQTIQKKLRKFGECFGSTFSNLSEKKDRKIQITLVLLATCFLWANHFQTVGKHLTITKINQKFVKELKELRNGTVDGRIFGHRAFGTANSFELAVLPYYTGKPGLMTYSRGYHDSLSVFYLESLKFTPDKIKMFVNALRLYNIHFLVTSDMRLREPFAKACQLKRLKKIDDLIFYEVLHQDNDYGYFDFVRIPGHIKGDLKLIRQPVLDALGLYQVNNLLLINPYEGARATDSVIVDVKKVPLLKSWDDFAQKKVIVTWSLNGMEANSEVILNQIIKADSSKWIYSQVIEERVVGSDYQAIVHVSDRGSDPSLAEHLLLKVTYHPFWKCFYYRVSDDFMLDMFNDSQSFDGKMFAHINHVIPNLMSVSLPPGRYLMIFTYRFPGIFKLLSVICAIGYLKLLFRYFSQSSSKKHKSTLTRRSIESAERETNSGSQSDTARKRARAFHDNAQKDSDTSTAQSDASKEQEKTSPSVSRHEIDTLPNFRLRKSDQQANSLRDWQVLVRATLQRRRIVHPLEQVLSSKEEEPTLEGRGSSPVPIECKRVSFNSDQPKEDQSTLATRQSTASSISKRLFKDQSIEDDDCACVDPERKTSNAVGRTRKYMSTSSNSETSGSENERGKRRSSHGMKTGCRYPCPIDSSAVNEGRREEDCSIRQPRAMERGRMSQEKGDYLLDVNANFTYKNIAHGSSVRPKDLVCSKEVAHREAQSSDSSYSEEGSFNCNRRISRRRDTITEND